MEEKVSVWKGNLTNGLILGIAGVVYTLVVYFLDLTFNQFQGYVFMIIQLGLLFFLLKYYRDNLMHGQITFGQSVGAGAIICLYYALIMAVFSYILYTMIDPGLVTKQLAFVEQKMIDKGLPQAAVDAAMSFQTKIMKPAIMAPFSIVANMFIGVIFSLLVSIFVKKEGNPLIDTTEN